jgi:hypothetical protein
MDALKKYKNLLIGVVVVVFLFMVYSYFFKEDSNPTLSSTVTAGATTPADNQLLLLLADLKKIRLNDTLFGDQGFKNLQDFGLELVPEPSGRRNPFSPIGVE